MQQLKFEISFYHVVEASGPHVLERHVGHRVLVVHHAESSLNLTGFALVPLLVYIVANSWHAISVAGGDIVSQVGQLGSAVSGHGCTQGMPGHAERGGGMSREVGLDQVFDDVKNWIEGVEKALVNTAATAVRVVGLEEVQVVNPILDRQGVGSGEGDDNFICISIVCNKTIGIREFSVEGGGFHIGESLAGVTGPIVNRVLALNILQKNFKQIQHYVQLYYLTDERISA